MWGTSISSRVKRVIKARVIAAQKKHDERCKEIEQEHKEAQAKLDAAKDASIEASADALVESIIGKN